LSKSEAAFMHSYNSLVTELIAVDDFASSELAVGGAVVSKPAKPRAKSKTKAKPGTAGTKKAKPKEKPAKAVEDS
jgi:hypothetical protein